MAYQLRAAITGALLTGALTVSSPALADELRLTPSGMSFEDTTFALENAIVGRGLVVDYVSHVGEMLERTREATGSDVVLFTNAEIYMFCSSTVSRAVMEADWQNVVYCPYGIHVIERPGEEVMIGYMHKDAESMIPANELLAGIIDEVTW
ncbi:DUF302 domain-containing protein [Rhodobacter sp. NTK016B]|uniref:DUF302 domain-containing protein n=1 Tax=Rhodobacter sp. NTK016B TaxID=2759676 RepID=UPI001A90658B|nr:DUF302 domain-containing protein [Rhodobacter sp. NTK016B]MBN8290790.1 DUF302 domain-containing protein [Rhodobacter sp. NTK016B]